jgi:hypothetical protein
MHLYLSSSQGKITRKVKFFDQELICQELTPRQRVSIEDDSSQHILHLLHLSYRIEQHILSAFSSSMVSYLYQEYITMMNSREWAIYLQDHDQDQLLQSVMEDGEKYFSLEFSALQNMENPAILFGHPFEMTEGQWLCWYALQTAKSYKLNPDSKKKPPIQTSTQPFVWTLDKVLQFKRL